jgi:uncharacterized protein (TIGR03067 family)
MRLPFFVACACGLLLSAVRAEDKPAGDREKLQGNWAVTSWQRGGQRVSPDIAMTARFTFAGDKLTILTGKDTKTEATIKLDPDKKPKEIDVDLGGNNVRKGIYQLDGDDLKVAYGEFGNLRPKEFPAKESGLTVWVLRRVKP